MAIVVCFVPTKPIYTDYHTGADMNICIYEPILPDNTWYFLGHSAVALPDGHHPLQDPLLDALAPLGIAIRSDDPTDSTSLSPVVPSKDDKNQYQPLWTDQHSGGDQNIELYSFQASNNPGNYVSLGLFAALPQHYGDDPTKQPTWERLR